MAQWIRRWSTEPEILGSIPSGVVSCIYKLFLLTSFSQCFSWTLRQALPLQKKNPVLDQIWLYNTPPLVTNAIEFVFQFQSWQLMMRIESEYSGYGKYYGIFFFFFYEGTSPY